MSSLTCPRKFIVRGLILNFYSKKAFFKKIVIFIFTSKFFETNNSIVILILISNELACLKFHRGRDVGTNVGIYSRVPVMNYI